MQIFELHFPEALNAWTMSTQRELAVQVRAASADSSIKAMIITGSGNKAFCAGQYLSETAAFGPDEVDGWLDNFIDLYDTVLSAPKPVIAALNGVAAGSGYQLAMLCDVRVGHPDVRIGQPEVKSGIPSITGLYITLQALGRSRTSELMLSGRLVSGEEAERIGLIHHLVNADRVLDMSLQVAETLASQPPIAVALTKKRMRDELWPGLAEAFEAARDIDKQAWGAGEPQETANAFLRRRRDGAGVSAASE